MILGDGLYNFGKVTLFMSCNFYKTCCRRKKSDLPLSEGDDRDMSALKSVSFDDEKRTRLFLKDQIHYFFAIAGYLTVAALSIATLPLIFRPLKWYNYLSIIM
jgi:hypothetical protein